MNTKLKCLLLDDELPSLTYLKMLCEQIPDLEIVKVFDNPEIFLKEIDFLNFDLCILDIEMPGIKGIHIAEKLAGKAIIFVTAYKEYAADAFDLDAIDYIRKPIKLERLNLAVSKAVEKTKYNSKPQEAYILTNTDKGKTLIYFDQIQYICSSKIDSRDKEVFMADGSIKTIKNMTFANLLEKLPFAQFCQINKNVIISLNIVHHFNCNEVTTNIILSNGKPLSFNLSKTFFPVFEKLIKH